MKLSHDHECKQISTGLILQVQGSVDSLSLLGELLYLVPDHSRKVYQIILELLGNKTNYIEHILEKYLYICVIGSHFLHI